MKAIPSRSLWVLLCVVTAALCFATLHHVAAAGQRKSAKAKPKAKLARATKPKLPAGKAAAAANNAASEQSARADANAPLAEILPADGADTRALAGSETDTEKEREGKRADEPDKALQYFLQKRLPEGETELPVERYFSALEEMKQMPLYSTAEHRLVAARANERKLAPEQQQLGAWTALGPGNIGGRTRVILVNPQEPNIMYAAGVAGGVWKSTNAGQAWTPLTDMLANIAVNSMAFDPKNPNVIYAGTGEGYFGFGHIRGAGMFKTVNAGQSWTRLTNTANNANFYYVNDLVVSAVDSNRVYAATNTGVWRSLDGGETWTRVLATTITGGCLDLAARTDQPGDTVFAACGTLDQATVYRKTDAEAAGSWEVVLNETGMGRTVLALAPSNQNVVYAVTSALTGAYTDALYAFFRSETGGAPGSFVARVRNTDANRVNTSILSSQPPFGTALECKTSTANSFGGQTWWNLALAVDPLDERRVWVAGSDWARSDDGGANWGYAAFAYEVVAGSLVYGKPNQLHPDQHTLVFHPQYNGTTNQQIFVGNDGGIWRSDNARAAVSTGPLALCQPEANQVRWTSLNNGYAVTEFYHGVVLPDGKSYFGGTQDNGTVLGTDGTGPNQWKQIILADGGYAGVDPNNPNVFYASTQNAGFRKSTDGGASFSSATIGLSLTAGQFITPLAVDPSNALRLYVGGDILNRSDNGMATWTNAGSLRSLTLLTDTMTAGAVAPTDSNQALFGMNSGYILRTTRALALGPLTPLSSAIETAARPRTGFVSWLSFDPNDRNIAYATYATFGGTHVWRSTNGGQTWTGLDGTGTAAIPDIPVHCLVVDTSNSARLYVGTDLGVFVSNDGGANWAVENTGFANAVTEALALNTVGGITSLYAFTHGRGAFKVTANMSGCNFALAQSGSTVAQAGSDLTVNVNVTPGGCTWKAESNVPWITLQPGAGGTTNGTVGMKVTANNSLATRSGTVAIAGRSFTVTQAGLPDIDSPTLRITLPATPTVNTTLGALNIAGTAADNARVVAVSWRSNRGVSGTATGTTNWAIANVPVFSGRNEITVTAADDAGNVSSAGLLVVNGMPASVLTTVVGTGATAYNGENIPAVAANITNPSGTLFFDGGGNFYFGDFNLARVRKVSASGLISTLAGTGVAGFAGDGGKATDAQVAQPRGAIADRNGNVYVLDSGNQRIRFVTAATGVITTVAGNGATGFSGDNGPATQASFNFGGLGAVALDANGNLLIADSSNNRIRRLAVDTGIVTTIVGTGTAGFSGDNGPATAALLRSPQSLYFDKDGNLFFADNGNFRIRKVATDGTITTVVGTGVSGIAGDGGPALTATIGSVFGIALDAGNNLYLSDTTNNRVRRVNAADGVINLVAGGGATGFTPDGAAAIGASLSLARHLGVDPQGFLYIAEANNFRIRKLINGVPNDTTPPTLAITNPVTGPTYTAPNAALSLSGTASDNGSVVAVRWSNDRGGSGAAAGTTNWLITGIGLQPGLNNLTVTAWDVSGNTASAQLAVTYTPAQVVVTVAGTGVINNTGDDGPGTAATLFQPRGVAVDSKGNVLVADTQNRRVRRIAPNGVITAFAGTGLIGSSGDGGPATEATLNFPNVVIVDKADNAYICDQLTHRIRKVAPDGKISTIAGTGEGFGGFGGDGGLATQAVMNNPVGLALDNAGNLFVADRSNYRIRRIDARTGVITTVAGNGQLGGAGDGGPATQAELNLPSGVAVDAAGNVYISDTNNQRIRRVSAADGRISTIAGTGTAGYNGDGGPATSALLNLTYPGTLSIDAAGDLYVVDRANHAIRKITLNNGLISTVAGIGVGGFNGDGTAPTGTALSFPSSVAFDAAGNLVIADSGNNRIRRVRPAAAVRALANVSAASFTPANGLAAEEIAAAFGVNLASATVAASVLPLPFTLAGTTVRVRDSLSVERLAPLFFVSADQLNYLVPSGTANGPATVTVTNGAAEVATGTINIANAAPGLFSANATGTGLAAAVVFRRTAAGVDNFEAAVRFDAATNRFVAVPIELGPEGDQVFLIPFGTGLRGLTGLANVQATIGGVTAPALFVGSVPGLVGADQANLRIDRSLLGRGEVDVVLTVDGKTANTVRVAIK
ncbi:MAG: hypothetical protein HYR56_27600 [Acidobacteria bacterium]|nr:hypothetical protein [Acidobacteriota bacterium]MBI3423528.1 hypothetical protein [Acidobacteriota bacterium]